MATKVFGIEVGSKKPSKKKVSVTDAGQASVKNFSPGAPGINILPPTVLEHYNVIALRKKFLITLGAIVAVLLLAFLGKALIANSNEGELAELEATSQQLNAQVSTLTPYENYITTVDGKRQSLVSQLSGDVDFATILTQFRDALNSAGVTVTSINVSSAAPAAGDPAAAPTVSECPSPDPFNPVSSIGCLTFTGYASSPAAAEALTTALAQYPTFVNPYIPNVTVTEGKADFDGSVAFTADLYNTRFFDEAESLQSKLLSAPSTTDSPAEETAAQPDAGVSDPATIETEGN